MRYAFFLLLLSGMTLNLGCSKAEVKEKVNPDPRVSDPYLGSTLDTNQSKPKQNKAK